MEGAGKPSDNLVRGFAFHKDQVYAVTHRVRPIQSRSHQLEHPDWENAETVIPEATDSIQSITKSKDFLFVVYSNGVVGRIVKYDLDTGNDRRGETAGLRHRRHQLSRLPDNQCIVFITSWTQPTTLYDFDADKDTFAKSIFNTDVRYPGFENLVTEEVEVPGHDGTMVPLSIIHRKDLPLDGSSTPSSKATVPTASATRRTSTCAIRSRCAASCSPTAHPRGGSEKGEAWYKAGYKTTKPNTWKDFIACAEYLVKKGYTSPDKLAGTGTSAGGILISRAITERPDLFGAAICNVGCANAMRMEFSAQRPGQHARIRHRQGPDRMPGALRDGRRAARQAGREVSRRPRRRRLERSARRALAARQVRRRAADTPAPPASPCS